MRRTSWVGGMVIGLSVLAAAQAPQYQVDALWPKPFPVSKHWILGSVTGVTVDLAHDDAVLIDDLTVGVAAVPEPATLGLLGAGLLALAARGAALRTSARTSRSSR